MKHVIDCKIGRSRSSAGLRSPAQNLCGQYLRAHALAAKDQRRKGRVCEHAVEQRCVQLLRAQRRRARVKLRLRLRHQPACSDASQCRHQGTAAGIRLFGALLTPVVCELQALTRLVSKAQGRVRRAYHSSIAARHGRHSAPVDGLVDGAQQLVQRALALGGRVRVRRLQVAWRIGSFKMLPCQCSHGGGARPQHKCGLVPAPLP